MTARDSSVMDTDAKSIWRRLSAPLPKDAISWRQDGKPVQRDGKFVARFVAYVDANTVRERLDAVVPGEYDLTLELLPAIAGQDEGDDQVCSFKARLQILGVIREDVGTGRDYKSAATDAFKRAAVRFGIAHELYGFEQNWVQVDGDGRYAKPLQDPSAVYAQRQARAAARESGHVRGNGAKADVLPERAAPDDEEVTVETKVGATQGPLALDEPSCPKCGGRCWDNRLSKRNPKAPDFKCRNRSCDGVIWPAKANSARTNRTGRDEAEGPFTGSESRDDNEADQVPF